MIYDLIAAFVEAVVVTQIQWRLPRGSRCDRLDWHPPSGTVFVHWSEP